MSTKQPKWRFLANLGDVNPFISAALVFIDMTGVYEPEIVLFGEHDMEETPDDRLDYGEKEVEKYRVHRFSLDRCSMQGAKWETLSDNRFHSDKPAWFADKLSQVADSVGAEVEELSKRLLSNDPLERAQSYIDMANYFGCHEFDSEPCLMTRGEIRRRYRAAFPRRKSKGINAHDPKQLVLDAGI